jgi:hypothetical protein
LRLLDLFEKVYVLQRSPRCCTLNRLINQPGGHDSQNLLSTSAANMKGFVSLIAKQAGHEPSSN